MFTVLPYRVLDEPWSPLLHTSRAPLRREAGAIISDVLGTRPQQGVSPAAVFDIARLSTGRFVLVEANQAWGAGVYGCGPDQVLIRAPRQCAGTQAMELATGSGNLLSASLSEVPCSGGDRVVRAAVYRLRARRRSLPTSVRNARQALRCALFAQPCRTD